MMAEAKMRAHFALYYPYPFIRDDTWLKRAALYWDKVFRSVPVNFHYAVLKGFRVRDHTPVPKLFMEESVAGRISACRMMGRRATYG